MTDPNYSKHIADLEAERVQLKADLAAKDRCIDDLEAEVIVLRGMDDLDKVAECNEHAKWVIAFSDPSPAREINLMAREYLTTKARLGRLLIVVENARAMLRDARFSSRIASIAEMQETVHEQLEAATAKDRELSKT